MRLGSLFSGYGGLDMAVESVTGATTAWVSDIDKGANKILAHRYPDVPNLGDIATVDWSRVEPVDVLTGGFPCQDLSHAGKRAGLRPDTRSGLWTHMAYAIDQLRPRLVVAENVRGLLSAEAHSDVEPCPWCLGDGSGQSPLRALGAVLGDLADLGYDASWYGLRAADVGACHGRFRVFVVACAESDEGRVVDREHEPFADTRRADGERGPGPVEGGASEGSAARTHERPAAPAGVGAGGALLPTPSASDTNGAGVHGDGGLDLRTPVSLLPTPTSRDHKGRNQRDDDTCLPGALLPNDAKRRLLPTPEAKLGINGGSQHPDKLRAAGHTVSLQDVTEHLPFGQYAAAVTRWETVLGRPATPPTEPTGRNDAHRLSPRFVEWMMGLPDGWVTDVPNLTRNEQLKALGNGVVPQQAEAALRLLLPMAVAA